jgi:hypothetical protein
MMVRAASFIGSRRDRMAQLYLRSRMSSPQPGRPTDTKIVIVGDKAYVTREEAQKQLAVVCKN